MTPFNKAKYYKAWRIKNKAVLKVKAKKYYKANKTRIKAQHLEYYHIMHYNNTWRLKYNRKHREYHSRYMQDPVKRAAYNKYIRNWMRDFYNIPRENWIITEA